MRVSFFIFSNLTPRQSHSCFISLFTSLHCLPRSCLSYHLEKKPPLFSIYQNIYSLSTFSKCLDLVRLINTLKTRITRHHSSVLDRVATLNTFHAQNVIILRIWFLSGDSQVHRQPLTKMHILITVFSYCSLIF